MLKLFKKIIVFIPISLIKFYQKYISLLFGSGKCRYYPVCSCYAIESYERFGLFKGSYLTLKRIISCNPWSKRDYIDLVPEKKSSNNN